MFRTNGALIGTRRAADLYDAAGVWWLEEQCRWQRISSWPVSKDPYISSVSLLLHMEDESGKYSFIDYSINDLAVTSIGDAQVSSTQSKFGSSSAYFDGTGDYLSIADNSVFSFGSGDFTIECWLYLSNLSSPYGVFGKRVNTSADYRWLNSYVNTSGTIQTQLTTDGSSWLVNTSTGSTITAGTWNHIAWVRSGSNLSVYVNGVKNTLTNSLSGSVFTDTSALVIGGTGSSGAYVYTLNGYIDELRITKGVARYTGNFPVPTSQFQGYKVYPILRTSNYSLYPSQTSTVTFDFVEAPVGFELGDVTTSGGVLSNLTAVNSTQYTATFTPTSAISYDTATITVNASGYTDRFGQSNTQKSLSFSVNNNGVDSNYSSVGLLLHMNGNNGATTFTDSSSSPLTITPSGRIQTSSTQSKFSGSSGYFNGSNSFLSVPTASGVFDFGSGNFTIESWIYLSDVSGIKSIAGSWPSDANGSWRFVVSGDALSFNGGTPQGLYSFTSSSCLTPNAWFHVAIVGNGSTKTLYCNGTAVGTTTNGSALKGASNPLSIGRNEAGNTWYFNGYIDDLRVTKGIARYTSNFTPPTTPFPDSQPVSATITSSNMVLVPSSTSTITFTFSHIPVGFESSDVTVVGGYLSGLAVTGNPYVYTATFNPTSVVVNDTATITVNPNTFSDSRGIQNISSSLSFIVNSNDAYFSNVSLLLHLNGSNGGTTFTDSSSNAVSVSAVGSAITTTSTFKFGGSSGNFTTNGSYLSFPNTAGTITFGSQDFTVEAWVYPLNPTVNAFGTERTIIGMWSAVNASQQAWFLCLDGASIKFIADVVVNDNTVVSATHGMSEAWNHVAVVRNSTTITVYINGNSVGSGSVGTSSITTGSNTGGVGGYNRGSGTGTFNGYIDEVRVTKGVARYTSNFTVPTLPFPGL